MMILLAAGFWRWVFISGGPHAQPSAGPAVGPGAGFERFSGLARRVDLHAGVFRAGCTALTGVEAISNGVQAFRNPPERNAARTMIWMVLLLGTMFLGITFLSHRLGVIVYAHSADPSEIVVGDPCSRSSPRPFTAT